MYPLCALNEDDAPSPSEQSPQVTARLLRFRESLLRVSVGEPTKGFEWFSGRIPEMQLELEHHDCFVRMKDK
jgi:hypothetical protein